MAASKIVRKKPAAKTAAARSAAEGEHSLQYLLFNASGNRTDRWSELDIVAGNMVNVVERPKILPEHVNPEGAQKWSQQGLHDSLSTHFDENYRSVRDGFSMPIEQG